MDKQALMKELAAISGMLTAKKKTAADVSLETDAFQTKFLSEEVKAMLNDQVGFEMYSAYVYFMLSAWSKSKGLEGFAKWFKGQGDDEIGHAMRIYNYLVDTGSDVQLPAIASPMALGTFGNMREAMRAALDHEMKVTKRWQIIGEASKREANLATQELAQWFAREQIEEEDKAVTLYQRVQLADTGAGLLIIDHELKG